MGGESNISSQNTQQAVSQKKLMKLSKINSSNNDPKNGDLKMVDLIKRAIYK